MLRWLSIPLAEHELDWLLSSGQIAADAQESIAVQAYMRALRGRGLERPQWILNAFLAQPPHTSLPPMWVAPHQGNSTPPCRALSYRQESARLG